MSIGQGTWSNTLQVLIVIFDFPLSIDFARPGIRPGSDTEALASSCSASVFGELHFLEAGSRVPSFAAFWDLGWERGGEVML